ncbi:MAG: hypothetical protein MMC33_010860, partial [Icmadophila ericetorum]|nr:hypothetical protein [Icmadophila ericetorum]
MPACLARAVHSRGGRLRLVLCCSGGSPGAAAGQRQHHPADALPGALHAPDGRAGRRAQHAAAGARWADAPAGEQHGPAGCHDAARLPQLPAGLLRGGRAAPALAAGVAAGRRSLPGGAPFGVTPAAAARRA